MKVYNIRCECYDEAYHDTLDRLIDGPYSTREEAVKHCPRGGSSMGSSYNYYIEEKEME